MNALPHATMSAPKTMSDVSRPRPSNDQPTTRAPIETPTAVSDVMSGPASERDPDATSRSSEYSALLRTSSPVTPRSVTTIRSPISERETASNSSSGPLATSATPRTGCR